MKTSIPLTFALLTCSAMFLAAAPQTLDELWVDFPEHDRTTPLETELLKEWEADGIVCRVVRFQVGVFKGRPSRVAGFYAFPKGAENLPALLSIHGGGGSASLDQVVTDARNGYAAFSLNWGGNKLLLGDSQATYEGPQTDWGSLDATHPPQRNKSNRFVGGFEPDNYTIDSEVSPRNNNWYVVLLAARRALTFLEHQPEVDAGRLGVYGHSMGGKLTTNLAGIDPRVKAAVPSCGGGGNVLESQTDLPGCIKKAIPPLELACISDNAYLPRITCPVLWLSPTNDFNAPISNMAWNWRNLPDERTRFSIAPHLNHRHTDEHHLTKHLWFEQHLKGAFEMPSSPDLVLNLKTANGVPAIAVTPDDAHPLTRVDIFYSTDPHELSRFWSDARAVKEGGQWKAQCPVMSLEQPLFAFANAVYETPLPYQDIAVARGNHNSKVFVISSRVHSVNAAALVSAGVNATAGPERLIDDGSRGWRDWYRLNWDHPPLWQAVTRKVKDARWRGPDGAGLVFEVTPPGDAILVIKVTTNSWSAFEAGRPEGHHLAEKTLKGGTGSQTVTVSLDDFTPPLANWRTVTELAFTPAREVLEGGKWVSVVGTPWQGSREIRNLRWEGGEYAETQTPDAVLTPAGDQKAFNEAIRKSLELEKADRR